MSSEDLIYEIQKHLPFKMKLICKTLSPRLFDRVKPKYLPKCASAYFNNDNEIHDSYNVNSKSITYINISKPYYLVNLFPQLEFIYCDTITNSLIYYIKNNKQNIRGLHMRDNVNGYCYDQKYDLDGFVNLLSTIPLEYIHMIIINSSKLNYLLSNSSIRVFYQTLGDDNIRSKSGIHLHQHIVNVNRYQNNKNSDTTLSALRSIYTRDEGKIINFVPSYNGTITMSGDCTITGGEYQTNITNTSNVGLGHQILMNTTFTMGNNMIGFD
jgi:hypothetical protein